MPPEAEPFLLFAAAVLGAIVGSFLNVCIYRLPREGLATGRPRRSFCPGCGMRIAWYDNVPIVSWMVLGGRCRGCRAVISIRYLVVEALTALLFFLVVRTYVFEGGGSWGGCLSLLLLVCGIVVAAFVDFDLRLVPDEVTVGGMHLLPFAALFFPDLQERHVDSLVTTALARAGAALESVAALVPAALRRDAAVAAMVAVVALALFAAGCVVYRIYRKAVLPDEPRRFRDVSLAGVLAGFVGGLVVLQMLRPELSLSRPVHSLWATLSGMLTGSGLVYLVGVVGTRLFRKPAMGFGDVKLMGLVGGLAGWWGAISGFFLACFLGAVYGIFRFIVYRDRYLPFVPFLAAGGLLVILWPGAWQAAIRWYLALFLALLNG